MSGFAPGAKISRRAAQSGTMARDSKCAAGKVFLLSQQGKATVIKAGADWEILAVNDLEDDTFATPAIFDNKLYLRTRGMLYCFSDKTAP